MAPLHLALLIVAALCFALSVVPTVPSHDKLMALGLLFLSLAFIF